MKTFGLMLFLGLSISNTALALYGGERAGGIGPDGDVYDCYASEWDYGGYITSNSVTLSTAISSLCARTYEAETARIYCSKNGGLAYDTGYRVGQNSCQP